METDRNRFVQRKSGSPLRTGKCEREIVDTDQMYHEPEQKSGNSLHDIVNVTMKVSLWALCEYR
jgi:hypothetical protein